jgi:hypothetical protein
VPDDGRRLPLDLLSHTTRRLSFGMESQDDDQEEKITLSSSNDASGQEVLLAPQPLKPFISKEDWEIFHNNERSKKLPKYGKGMKHPSKKKDANAPTFLRNSVLDCALDCVLFSFYAILLNHAIFQYDPNIVLSSVHNDNMFITLIKIIYNFITEKDTDTCYELRNSVRQKSTDSHKFTSYLFCLSECISSPASTIPEYNDAAEQWFGAWRFIVDEGPCSSLLWEAECGRSKN